MLESAAVVKEITNIYRAYVCPVLSVFGILGNLLILVTFAFNINNKFVIYCTSLAIYNSFALLTNTFMDDFLDRGLRYWTNNKYFISIEIISNGWCLFMEYVPNVMYFASCYVMVAFSMDRTLVIALPIKYSPYRGYKVTIFVCVMIGVSGCVVSSPLLHGYSLNTTIPSCDISHQAAGNIGLYLKSLIIFVVPTILVANFNLVIYGHLLRIRNRHRQLSDKDSRSMRKKKKIQANNTNVNNKVRNVRDSKSEMGRIVTHLVLSTVFLLLTVPLSISIILRLIVSKSQEQIKTPYGQTVIQLTKMFSSVKDIGYAVNFILYIIFIPSFKYDFFRVFKCQWLLNHLRQEETVSLRSKQLYNNPNNNDNTSKNYTRSNDNQNK